MNVTEVPEQTGLMDGDIETLTGRVELTIIVIEFDVAGLLITQMVSDDISTQVTTSLLTGV